MANKNKSEYLLGRTYFTTPDGRTFSVQGDQRNDEILLNQDYQSPTFQMGGTTEQKTKARKMVNDLVTDVATQAPLVAGSLLLPGAGGFLANAGKAAAAGTASYSIDKLLNPDKPSGEAITDAAINTTLGMAIPGLIERPIFVHLPPILTGQPSPGWGIKGMLMSVIPRFSRASSITTGAAPQGIIEQIRSIPPAATRGAGGRFLSSAALAANQAARKAQVRDVIFNQLKESLLKNSTGVGGNFLFDLLFNRPSE